MILLNDMSNQTKRLRILFVVLCMFILNCAGCTENTKEDVMLPLPVKAGTVVDKNSDYVKYWPGKPALHKLKDNLILAIPPQYNQFWLQRDWLGRDEMVRPPTPIEKIPQIEGIGFQMFMPDFSGYTPENYKEEFHLDLIQIMGIYPASMSAIEPGAPGYYPPNMFERLSGGEYPSFDVKKYKEEYGLRCYEVKTKDVDSKQWCYGKRNEDEYILLTIMRPPYSDFVTYPIMQARYFTKKYGGLVITWHAHMKHFPDWKKIDAQIWQYVDAWNIAPQSTIENK